MKMKNLNSITGKLFIAIVMSMAMMPVSEAWASGNKPIEALDGECSFCPVESVMLEDTNKVESWMYSNSYWGSLNVAELNETEESANIEGWMFSNVFWGTTSSDELSEADALNKIEKWMMDNHYWGTINVNDVSESDDLNFVEVWMGSESYWSYGVLNNNASLNDESSLASEK